MTQEEYEARQKRAAEIYEMLKHNYITSWKPRQLARNKERREKIVLLNLIAFFGVYLLIIGGFQLIRVIGNM